MSAIPEFLDIWGDTLQWQPDAEVQAKFEQLYAGILAGNQQLNLTRITEPSEFWEKHLWDSLSALVRLQKAYPEKLKESLCVIDVGTGGGFPGIPIAIAHPHWLVTLLDSTHKKIAFLDDLTTRLSLNNTITLTGRAEAVGRQRKHRSAYDLVCIRAVGNANICAQYALPLLKVGGMAILYRGQWTEEEARLLEKSVEALGSKIEGIQTFKTPLTHSIRHCIYLSKQSESPDKFPKIKGQS